MKTKHNRSTDEDEKRLKELLSRDLDAFLATSSDSDFVFHDRKSAKPSPRPRAVVLPRALNACALTWRRWAFISVAILLIGLGGVFYSSRFAKESSDANLANTANPPEIAANDVSLASLLDNLSTKASATLRKSVFFNNLGVVGIERMKLASQRFYEKDVDLLLEIPNTFLSWPDDSVNESDTELSNTFDAAQDSLILNEQLASALGPFSSKEVILASVNVGTLVIALERYYNRQ
jgi:hypothetical protein